jgi:hypothetical protein
LTKIWTNISDWLPLREISAQANCGLSLWAAAAGGNAGG